MDLREVPQPIRNVDGGGAKNSSAIASIAPHYPPARTLPGVRPSFFVVGRLGDAWGQAFVLRGVRPYQSQTTDTVATYLYRARTKARPHPPGFHRPEDAGTPGPWVGSDLWFLHRTLGAMVGIVGHGGVKTLPLAPCSASDPSSPSKNEGLTPRTSGPPKGPPKKGKKLELEPFVKLDRTAKKALDEEASALAAFL